MDRALLLSAAPLPAVLYLLLWAEVAISTADSAIPVCGHFSQIPRKGMLLEPGFL